jgi:hypothetical protein
MMAQLETTAVAMVDAQAEEVYAALTDYESVRPGLLTAQFTDYRVCSGGHGAGTEVCWKMQLGEKKRERRRWQPWDCQVRVEEPGGNRLVERDTNTGLVTEWSLHPGDAGRCAVRISATWQGPDGAGGLLERPRQRLAMRQLYEGVLTKLHEHFAPTEPDEDEDGDADQPS